MISLIYWKPLILINNAWPVSTISISISISIWQIHSFINIEWDLALIWSNSYNFKQFYIHFMVTLIFIFGKVKLSKALLYRGDIVMIHFDCYNFGELYCIVWTYQESPGDLDPVFAYLILSFIKFSKNKSEWLQKNPSQSSAHYPGFILKIIISLRLFSKFWTWALKHR